MAFKAVISRGSGLSFVSVCVSVFAGFELAREKLPGGTDSLLLGVGVVVEGCLNVRVSHDALMGLDGGQQRSQAAGLRHIHLAIFYSIWYTDINKFRTMPLRTEKEESKHGGYRQEIHILCLHQL